MKGNKAEKDGGNASFLHLGIANRSFERRFELADFVRVDDARLNDGLLTIELLREVPEAMKPKTIAIKTGAPLAAVDVRQGQRGGVIPHAADAEEAPGPSASGASFRPEREPLIQINVLTAQKVCSTRGIR